MIFDLQNELERRGWKPVYDPTAESWGMDIYEGNGRILVLPEFDCPFFEEIPEIFERLRDLILSRQFPMTDIVLEGGGSIPIPDWFLKLCKEIGIKLHIVTDEVEIPDLPDEIKRHE